MLNATVAGREATVTGHRSLTFIRWGRWSGCAISLREALKSRATLLDYDLMPLARRPSLLPVRIRAMLEAARTTGGAPWEKTGSWSRGIQRTLLRDGLLTSGRPILFCQSISALVLDSSFRYAVYTDRVGREGAAAGGSYASRFTPAWLCREEAFLRGAQHVFVMGPSTKDLLISGYSVPESRITVVGTAPNMPLGPLRQSGSCHALLFVGSNWKAKGGPELLRAFGDVRREFPHLELVLVGDMPPGPVGAGIRVAGRVPPEHMSRFYSMADAMVIPSHIEGFGNALTEGLMMGLPCIGTTVGNQPWIIGDAGECVPPGDSDAIGRTIRKMINVYPEYAHRARARAQRLRAIFTWEKIATTILETLSTTETLARSDTADL